MKERDHDEETVRQGIKNLGVQYRKNLSIKPLMKYYNRYMAIRSLVPEVMWHNYTLLGIRDLQEQILLRKALKDLREEAKRLRRVADEEKAANKAATKAAKGMRSKRKRKSATTSNS